MIYNIDLRDRGTIPSVEFCIFIDENPDEILYEFRPSKDKTDVEFTYYGELLNKTMVFLGKGFERRVVLTKMFIKSVLKDRKKDKIFLSINICNGIPPFLPRLSDAELMASFDFEKIRNDLKENKITNTDYLTIITKAIGLFGVSDDIELLIPYLPGPMWASRLRIDILMSFCVKHSYKTEKIAEIVDEYFKKESYAKDYDTDPLCISFRRLPLTETMNGM